MITYPILLKSLSGQEGVVHMFELIEGATEGAGFEFIDTWLKLPWTKDTTHTCVACGATLDIPDGSLEAHLKKYQVEHGGKDTLVRVVYRHKGPRPAGPLVGRTVVTDPKQVTSFKDFIKAQEASNQNS